MPSFGWPTMLLKDLSFLSPRLGAAINSSSTTTMRIKNRLKQVAAARTCCIVHSHNLECRKQRELSFPAESAKSMPRSKNETHPGTQVTVCMLPIIQHDEFGIAFQKPPLNIPLLPPPLNIPLPPKGLRPPPIGPLPMPP